LFSLFPQSDFRQNQRRRSQAVDFDAGTLHTEKRRANLLAMTLMRRAGPAVAATGHCCTLVTPADDDGDNRVHVPFLARHIVIIYLFQNIYIWGPFFSVTSDSLGWRNSHLFQPRPVGSLDRNLFLSNPPRRQWNDSAGCRAGSTPRNSWTRGKSSARKVYYFAEIFACPRLPAYASGSLSARSISTDTASDQDKILPTECLHA
jgi:hypothetical protein